MNNFILILFFRVFVIFVLFYNSIVMSRNVDIELEMEIENIVEGVEFQQSGDFIVTIKNNGPNDAGIDATVNFPISVSTAPIFQSNNGFIDISISKNNSISQECSFVNVVGDPLPGGQVSYSYKIGFPLILKNSSITCYGRYHIGFESGSRSVKWFARSPTDTDINLGNERVEWQLFIKPKTIPSLSNRNILLLIIMFIFISSRKIKVTRNSIN